MRTVNFSEARSNLKAVFDRVIEDADVTIITRRDADDVVVMSLAEWNSWQETNYLLASPANARRLTEALAQARAGRAKSRPGFPAHVPSVHEKPAAYKVAARRVKRGTKAAAKAERR